MKLDGALTVVTGASSGIGEATARLLSARGSKVILLARNKGRLDKIVAEIRAQGVKRTATRWIFPMRRRLLDALKGLCKTRVNRIF